MLEHDVDTRTAITALGLSRIDSDATLQPFVERAITDLPAAASDVRSGKRKALDALKGHVMRATKGKADPQALESLLLRSLLG
jgi:aspartyl-tRNA(Asn)/glutamyl-tRNA(Gln) amidotransferase subunit B